ncbi:terpene synthase family protein [Micromonospora sp. CB01531]|uniref:terpene synthase family protein n=1 Tax=Micromonospora sp. CB01531 TaxID=1718947 RepID=UPI00093FAFA0|nr:hypothetical protein [Micromonospora sp. CB01531]OKI54683.1 hypothetical protein A6A27_31730 [Micromonospora sp. CB01531]
MPPTRSLRFYCPLSCEQRPDATYLGQRALEWADHFGLVAAAERRRLARIDIGLLTSLVLPHGLYVPAQIAADFSAWLFALDDRYCDERQQNLQLPELAALLARLTRVLEAPTAEPSSGSTPAWPFISALRDLRLRLAAVATPTQVARWVAAMRAYFTATLWEATNRTHKVIPDLDAYTMLRMHSGAMGPSILLLDIADGYELSTTTMSRPDVQALMEMTCVLAGWDNDLISYDKEAARVGDGQNLLDVLAYQNQSTTDQALHQAIALRDRVMSLFLRLRERVLHDASPELARYVTSLSYWVRANIQWGQQSARYGSTDGLTNSMPPGRATHPTDNDLTPLPIPTIRWWWQTLDREQSLAASTTRR